MTDSPMKIEARFDAALLDELRRDNARLRWALEAIVNDCTEYINDEDGPGPVETMQAMRQCATTALAAERGQS